MPSVPQGARGAIITGWGTALPDKTLTNADLETMFDTSGEWIVERTGIRERRVGGTTAALSVESGRQALEMAGLDPSDIDALILATTTPDRAVPATSATVQNLLGLTCGAYDINAACSGWVYGLITAHGLIAMGANKVLLIGTDTLARITDWTDRNTAILFADGSGATVLEAVDGPGEMLGWDLDSDGSAEEALYCELGGNLEMEGKEVFRRAVRIMVDSATRSMEHAGVVADDIALGVELAQHRIGHAGTLEVRPQLKAVAGEVVEVHRDIAAGVGVQTLATVVLDDLAELVGLDQFTGRILRGGEGGFQLFEFDWIGVDTLQAFGLERVKGHVFGGHGLEFRLDVLGPDLTGALEGHMLQDVGQSGDAPDLVGAADVHERAEGKHRHIVVFQNNEVHSIVESEFLDLTFEVEVRLGAGDRCT